MISSNIIQVYEYSELKVDVDYGINKNIKFKEMHFQALAKYATENYPCPYFNLFHKRIRFCNYVGVIKIGDITIEVLPKCDRYDDDKQNWQEVLLEMLAISLKVDAKTTTDADIHIRQHNVLETYLNIFLDELVILLHQGLVKKYRTDESNQTSLKGKLQIHKNILKNIVHAERFYVSHQVYDRNNVYNSIIYQALCCIFSLNVTISLNKRCHSLLLDFPECSPILISDNLFKRLQYDRKTERYKKAINLARIILMNYHPDIKGGSNNILAIMFDMNLLWENYIYYVLKRAESSLTVKAQRRMPFWQYEDKWKVNLIPDIVVTNNKEESIVLDTKWKYEKDVSMHDLRQMYAYGKYFNTLKSYLVYPDKITDVDSIEIKEGAFYHPGNNGIDKRNLCGLLYVDLLKNNKLNKEIGKQILTKLGI